MRIPIPYTVYPDSPKATKKSITGTMLIVFGIPLVLAGIGIFLIIIGIIMRSRAKYIAECGTDDEDDENEFSSLGKKSLWFGIFSFPLPVLTVPGLICGIKCIVSNSKNGYKQDKKAIAGVILSFLALCIAVTAIICLKVNPPKK